MNANPRQAARRAAQRIRGNREFPPLPIHAVSTRLRRSGPVYEYCDCEAGSEDASEDHEDEDDEHRQLVQTDNDHNNALVYRSREFTPVNQDDDDNCYQDGLLARTAEHIDRLSRRFLDGSSILNSMSSTRPAGGRQALRNGIVQHWEPNSNTRASNGITNGTTNGTRNHHHTPLTPPTNAEDEADYKRRELENLIQQQVEDNGIQRPKGYTVSFHYNRRVEEMHFGRAHPMKPWRLTLTKHLVMGYGLQFAMDNYEALPASQETVAMFHDPEYVDFLSR